MSFHVCLVTIYESWHEDMVTVEIANYITLKEIAWKKGGIKSFKAFKGRI